MFNASQLEKNQQEILVAGDMLGEPVLASRILKKGGTIKDFYKAYVDRPVIPTLDHQLGLTTPDNMYGYSLCRLIASQAHGRPQEARHEHDVSSVLMNKTGLVPRGAFVPFSALARDFNVGTATEAGNLIGADRLGEYSVDPLRKIFTLRRLGATFITGLKATAAVPVFVSATTPAYQTETGAATEVFESTRLVTLTPKRIACVFIMSRQAALQSTPELDIAIKSHLAQAIEDAMQGGILAGYGSGENPVGILNNANVNIVVGGTDGATLTYQHIVDMENGPAASNVPDAARGWVINSSTQKYLRTKAKGTGLPYILENAEIIGAPVITTNTLPSNLTKGTGTNLSGLIYSGDWSNLLIGIYGAGIDLTVDRVTLAASGQLRVVASIEVGFGLREPTAFSVMKDAKLV